MNQSIEQEILNAAGKLRVCWGVQGMPGRGMGSYNILPSGNMNLILRFSPCSCQLVLLGPVTELTRVEFDESSDYLGIVFPCAEPPSLADVCPSELVDTFVDIPRLFGEDIGSLSERLLALPDFVTRSRFLEAQLRGTGSLLRDKRCHLATSVLEAHGGGLQIQALADGLGTTRRSLERLFRKELGLSPKQLSRLVRFRRLLLNLNARIHGSLTELAVACGYADQSHMIREFKEMTGRLPSEKAPHDLLEAHAGMHTRVSHHGAT
ncbi:MAG: helix-turn-helix transcriptional regulator [Humidesulfovibrio sp.]|nr:helix-turn-helix transcriptional regulator [Humidesulfovibrio sp.]